MVNYIDNYRYEARQMSIFTSSSKFMEEKIIVKNIYEPISK